MDISQERLNELISCPKDITPSQRQKFEEINGSRRLNLKLYSEKANLYFQIFLRQNTMLLENFSVGLIWEACEVPADIIILRCNGLHGGNKNCEHHCVPHIHRLNLELATIDIFKEDDVELTTEYTTFDSAIYYFCTMCNIQNAAKYFPESYNLSLFDS
jgi:hypothetical protein